MQLINAQLKKLFKDSIDQIVGTNGLTTKCLIRYGSLNHQLCNNCKFDPITKSSSNIYNGTGPAAFDDYQICPVCLGQGRLEHTDTDTLYLAVLFDSKYWFKTSAPVNIADGAMQTISPISTMLQIRAANDLKIDSDLKNHGNYVYERASDPEPAGLGSADYVITMWKRK